MLHFAKLLTSIFKHGAGYSHATKFGRNLYINNVCWINCPVSLLTTFDYIKATNRLAINLCIKVNLL